MNGDNGDDDPHTIFLHFKNKCTVTEFTKQTHTHTHIKKLVVERKIKKKKYECFVLHFINSSKTNIIV